MKKILLVALLGLAFSVSGLSQRRNDALNQIMEDKEDFDAAMLSFQQGNAKNGEEYFFGVQAGVVWIDVKLRSIEYLDSMDVKAKVLNAHLDVMLTMIEDCKRAMVQYEGKGWKKQNELRSLTIEWLNAVKMLVNDHLRGLALPMSIPDKKWKDAYYDAYDAYLAAYEIYLEIDSRWVDFQYEYAEANGFALSDETN
jgi:hypothetical protein